MNHKDRYIQLIRDQEIRLPLFLQPELYQNLLGDNQWEVAYIEENNRLVASWIVHCKSKYGFKIASIPALIKYGGPYFFDGKPTKDKVSTLIKELGIYQDWIQNTIPDYDENIEVFQDHFEIKPYYTYQICNQNHIEKTWQNISRNYRNNKIKKAKRNLEVIEDIDLDTFYRINELSFARQHIDMPYSLLELSKMDDYLDKKKQRKIFTAIDKWGNIHSVAYLAWDNACAYYVASGDDPELRKSGSGILLAWHCISYAFEILRMKKFDFLGSMVPQIEKVRQDLGGVKTPYLNLNKSNHTFKLLKTIRRTFSNQSF